MKRGLVLEGRAMRGLFTADVLDMLMECGVAFDGVLGTHRTRQPLARILTLSVLSNMLRNNILLTSGTLLFVRIIYF